MLNIPSTVVDSNYRYRMPKMQIKQQSKGNGIRTNVVNLQDVAKSLRTDQAYILKFFGFQKASQTTEKSSETKSNKTAKTNTSYIIQGSFTEEDLRKVLDKFIDKYILCPKCKLPELNMYIANEKIHGKCDSCPFNGEIDNKHKLTGYIVKNPPVIKTQAIKQTKIIDKQEKTEEKSEKNGKKVEETVESKKKQDDMGEQAKNLFEAQNLQFGSADLQKLIQHTRNFITNRKDKDFDIASAETVEDLKPLGLKKTLLAYILFNGLFTINIAKQVKQGAPMYKKLMKRQKYMQYRLVSGSDENNQTQTLLNLQYLFLEVNKEKDYSKYLPTITYKLHENGLLSKDLLLKWAQGKIKDFDKFFLYNETRNEQFIKINQQFIDSLKDDDDDEEES